jgi:hypothetical protein
MAVLVYNLFTEDACGNPVWLDAVADFEVARIRLTQLASVNPGEYFIFNLRTQQIVTSLVSTCDPVLEDSREPAALRHRQKG